MRRNLPESVLLLHNEPESKGIGGESVAGVMDQVHAVEKALVSLGVHVERVGAKSLSEAGRAITRSNAPVVFNLVEAFAPEKRQTAGRDAPPYLQMSGVGRTVPGAPSGLGDAELIPALCRTFGKGVTGNETPALLLTLDKWKTKSILGAAGIMTPNGMLVRLEDEVFMQGVRSLPDKLCWTGHRHKTSRSGGRSDSVTSALLGSPPWIVKPVSSDASEGITCDSIIRQANVTALRKQVARVHREFHQAALIETCIGDREINVSLFQTAKGLKVLPLAEIDFSRLKKNEPKIVDYDAKWKTSSHRYKATRRVIPAKLPKDVAERVRTVARAAWSALGCRHYARVDLRLDGAGLVYVLEVNANPDISPDAGFVAALEAGGLTFKSFVRALVLDAYVPALDTSAATTEPPDCSGACAKRRPERSKLSIRRSRASDRSSIEKLLQQPAYFKPHEIPVGLEVLDDAHKGGPNGHYQSFVSTHKGRVTGWICFGPTPCTEGTFDVYWIAVAPKMQGRGIGGALLRFAEACMVARAARMNLMETAGRPDYEPTRRFYRSMGYQEVSRIPDFYAPGDDKVTFAKKLGR